MGNVSYSILINSAAYLPFALKEIKKYYYFYPFLTQNKCLFKFNFSTLSASFHAAYLLFLTHLLCKTFNIFFSLWKKCQLWLRCVLESVAHYIRFNFIRALVLLCPVFLSKLNTFFNGLNFRPISFPMMSKYFVLELKGHPKIKQTVQGTFKEGNSRIHEIPKWISY